MAGTVLLAHGAGAGKDHPFMLAAESLLARAGLRVVRFNFPYMERRMADGVKRPPDRMPLLEQAFLDQIDNLSLKDDEPLYLAGKSMGGRVATHILEQSQARACFVFGYPFHPLKRPEKLRTEHLQSIARPVYIFQGVRDGMGSREEVVEYPLSSSVVLHWLEDGDHDLNPRKRSGYTQKQHLESVGNLIKGIIG